MNNSGARQLITTNTSSNGLVRVQFTGQNTDEGNHLVLQNWTSNSWVGPMHTLGPAQLNQCTWAKIWAASPACTGFYTYYLSSYSLHLCQESLKQCCCPLIGSANTHPASTTACCNYVKTWINSAIQGFISICYSVCPQLQTQTMWCYVAWICTMQ